MTVQYPAQMAPDFMVGINAYLPHKEWMLTSAYLLRACGPAELKTFWIYAASKETMQWSEPINQLYEALSMYDMNVARFLQEEYEVTRDAALNIQAGVHRVFKEMTQYFEVIRERIHSFYEGGFFDKYASLSEAVEAFCQFVLNSKNKSYKTFVTDCCMEYFFSEGIELPVLYTDHDNSEYIVVRDEVRWSVLAHIIDYFEPAQFKQWIQGSDPRVVTPDCPQHGSNYMTVGSELICADCYEDVSFDMFPGHFVGF